MSKVYNDICELAPNAQIACRAFLKRCSESGLAVRVTETYRSQQRQNELYAQGRTTAGAIVTWTKNSRHTSRRAWDICQNIKGKEYSDVVFFEECAKVAKELGIIWGGNWKTPDRPHFEVDNDWKEDDMANYEEKIKQLEEEISKLKEGQKVYHYTKDVPDWGRAIVQELLDRGIFSGRAADDLDLSEDMLRVFVTNYNAGLYK